jgi:hypothetical protein
MIAATLRMIAVAIAVGAFIDPGLVIRRTAPLAVDVRATAGDAGAVHPDTTAVRTVKQRLDSDLRAAATFNSAAPASAIVFVGDRIDAGEVPEDISVSTVSTAAPEARGFRIVRTENPRPVLPGWSATVRAEIEANGLAGRTSAITLEQNGITLHRIEHQWKADAERFMAELPFAAPTAGFWPLTLRVKSTSDEPFSDAADVRVIAASRTLKVIIWDSRPSWTSAFVRRALEADPTFSVSTIVRASRDIEVRTASSPSSLSAASLEPFDLVLIGAPEELTSADISSLETFARRRGGAVALLPDRQPTGRYLDLVTGSGFDEILVDKPVVLAAGDLRLRASELAVPHTVGPETSGLLTFQHEGLTRPVIFSEPLGAGRILFSGALDAWRFRAADDEAFARFWRSQIAIAAAASPRRLEVTAHPAIPRPGSVVRLRVAVRPTELVEDAARTTVPGVSAEVIREGGATEFVRLWPSAEAGVYEGVFRPSTAGKYDVRAHMMSVTADTVVMVSDGPAGAQEARDDSLQLVARATGGVAVSVMNLAPVATHLRSLPRHQVNENHYPMRSAWWMLVFVALLSGEWTLRRRAGQR